MSSVGRRLAQNAGRSGRPKIAQRMSGSSCTQGIPAGLPCGMPGIGEVIEGAMQQAPHSERQFNPRSSAPRVVPAARRFHRSSQGPTSAGKTHVYPASPDQ
jgi:hypothetical protein